MKKIYTYLALAGVVAVGLPAWATGLPTYSFLEVVTMKVDSIKNVATQDLLQTHKNLVKSTLEGVKGGAGAEEMTEKLSGGSSVVTGRNEGLQTLMEEGNPILACGEGEGSGAGDSLVALLNAKVVYPAEREGRDEWTTERKNQQQEDLAKAVEMAATTSLAKAWLAQAEAAGVSERLTALQEKLAADSSQMDVLTTILMLQEETQKNINVRLSIMGDELVSEGLSALDTGV